MRRREFIKVIAGSATAWPLATRVVSAELPVVGFVYLGTPEANADLAAAFRKGLGESGYIDGQNVTVEYRWANSNATLLEMIADLTSRNVAVIAAAGNAAAVAAVAAKTSTIPIVFNIANDPVEAGFVTNLAKPGGNVTGVTTMNSELGAKWLGLLHDLLPNATRFAVLVDPSNVDVDPFDKHVDATASARGWQIDKLEVNSNEAIDNAFARLVQQRTDALMIAPGSLFRQRLVKLATLATRYNVPAVYPLPQFAEVGGLMSYGTSFVDNLSEVGIYVGRILKGAKPAELPVLQPTKFDFVINLSTAKALGLNIPAGLLAIADRVIE